MFRALTLASLLLSVQAAPMGTCQEQANCLQMNFREQRASTCAGGGRCEWLVCLILDYSLPCLKEGTISHTCQKSSDICGGGAFQGSTYVDGVGEGTQLCQVGSPETKLTFLLKDGAGCASSSAQIASGTQGLPDGASMSCSPTVERTQTCTGNPLGVECIWEVTLPPCELFADSNTGGSTTGGSTTEGSTTGGSTTEGSTTGGTATGGIGSTVGGTVVDEDEDANAPLNNSTSQAGTAAEGCGGSVPCQNGQCIDDSWCECKKGYGGPYCETLQCNSLLATNPNMKVLDGGKVPTCTIQQAAAPLEPYDCVEEVAGCNVLKCNKPVPPEVINGIRSSCPDGAI